MQLPDIEAFNAELPEFCKGYVWARSEELATWRRRGHQHRERELKLWAFKKDQPPIDPVLPAWKTKAAELLKQEQQDRRIAA